MSEKDEKILFLTNKSIEQWAKSQHIVATRLQYPVQLKSFAMDLSLPIFETDISRRQTKIRLAWRPRVVWFRIRRSIMGFQTVTFWSVFFFCVTKNASAFSSKMRHKRCTRGDPGASWNAAVIEKKCVPLFSDPLRKMWKKWEICVSKIIFHPLSSHSPHFRLHASLAPKECVGLTRRIWFGIVDAFFYLCKKNAVAPFFDFGLVWNPLFVFNLTSERR